MKHTPAPWGIFKENGIIYEIGPIHSASWLEISEDDARLIAAAPELLEACKIIVNAFDSLSQSSPARNETLHINAARAAIAKATGAE